MKNTFKIAAILILLAAGSFVLATKIRKEVVYKNPPETPKTVSEFSDKDKIGQLFIIGIDGDSVTPETERIMREWHPGGVLLLSKNIKNETQLKQLITGLQIISLEETGLPLFIAVDQEGGQISRIPWVEKTAPYALQDTPQAQLIGKTRANQLMRLGVNLNLAPMLDVSQIGDFIYGRAFRRSPFVSGELAKGLVKGQKETGLMTAIKHFPGYGGIYFNPEEKLAVLSKIPEISQFSQVMSENPEMVMPSNVIYNDIDPEKPFSFSEKGIAFLKEKLGEKVVIISDDLARNSVLNKYGQEGAVMVPFNAGNDLLIFSGWQAPVEAGLAAFKKAFEEGRIKRDRVNYSFGKILPLKEKLLENF